MWVNAWASVRTPEGGHAQSCTRLRVQRGDAASAGYGRTGSMSCSRYKCSWPRASTMPPHGDGDRSRPGAGCSHTRAGGYSALRKEPGGGRPAPLPEVAGWKERLQRHTVEHVDVLPYVQILDAPGAAVGGQYDGFSSVAWTFRLPSRLSMCPGSPRLHVLPVRFSGNRRWWNSWWTCLSSTLSSCSSGIPLTFQFRRVGLLVEVNKVFSLDRVRWSSKSLTFQPQVVDFLAVYMVFPQDRASLSGLRRRWLTLLFLVFLHIFIRQLSRRFCRMRLVKGFFRKFPRVKKKVRHRPSHSGSDLPPHSSPWKPAACAVPTDREEEQERRRQETQQQASEALEMARLQLDQASTRRKRKNGRKRRLPKSSSHSSRRRSSVACVAVFVPGAEFFCAVVRPQMLFITAGVYQKDSYAARMPLFPCEGGPRILKSLRDSVWRFYEPFVFGSHLFCVLLWKSTGNSGFTGR